MTRAQRRRIVAAIERLGSLAIQHPQTSGAALAALFLALHNIYLQPEKLFDQVFLTDVFFKVAAIWGLMRAADAKHTE